MRIHQEKHQTVAIPAVTGTATVVKKVIELRDDIIQQDYLITRELAL